LIILANNDGLSAPFGLGGGNVLNSPFALAFLRAFVFLDRDNRELAAPDWKQSPEQFRERIAHLEEKSNGYDYRHEVSAHGRIQQYLSNRAARARPEIQVDSEALNAFVGAYRQSTDLTITIGREGERLTGQRTYEQNGRKFVFDKEILFSESPTKFFDKTSDAQVTFVRDTTGKVTHLLLRLNNQVQKLSRAP